MNIASKLLPVSDHCFVSLASLTNHSKRQLDEIVISSGMYPSVTCLVASVWKRKALNLLKSSNTRGFLKIKQVCSVFSFFISNFCYGSGQYINQWWYRILFTWCFPMSSTCCKTIVTATFQALVVVRNFHSYRVWLLFAKNFTWNCGTPTIMFSKIR